MKKALLVIDMQNVCVGENHSPFFKYDNSKLIENVNAVISGYEPENVYYIMNIIEDSFINKFAPFKAPDGSKEAELVDSLSVVSGNKFKKYKGDAFSNKELCAALKASEITDVEIVGVDGGGCVALTALGAIREGFNVTINTGSVGTTFVKQATKFNAKLKRKSV